MKTSTAIPGARTPRSPVGNAMLAALIGTHPAIVAVRNEVEKLADSKASVLITGPTGSGKDVVAQLLH